MWTVVLCVVAFIVYIGIGIATMAYLDADDEAAFFGTIFWPVVWAFWIVALPIIGAVITGDKGLKAYRKWQKRKIPPTPTQVMQGIVATVVLQHFKEWIHEESYFKYKNIEIHGNGRYVKVGNDDLEISEELKEALDKSRSMSKDWRANQATYEKEQRMLGHLEEFMSIVPAKQLESIKLRP